MGFSFPVLQRVVQTDLDRLGRRVGLLLVANVGGSVLGTVFTGWVLLSVLGTADTLKVLTAMSGTFTLLRSAWFGLRMVRWSDRTRLVRAGMGVRDRGCARLDSLPDAQCRPTLGAPARDHRLSESSTARMRRDSRFFAWSRRITAADHRIRQWAGSEHDAVRRSAHGAWHAAGLHSSQSQTGGHYRTGVGDTVYGAAGRPEIERITCMEIIRSQLDTLRALSAVHPYAGLLGLAERSPHRIYRR